MHQLLSFEKTSELIKQGAVLAIAGAPKLLRTLPHGRWMGGTTYYFVDTHGGRKSDADLFVTDLTRIGGTNFHVYHAGDVERIIGDTPGEGFSLVIMPAASHSLREFAEKGHSSDALFKAVVGWVAGTDVSAADAPKPFVIDGRDGKVFDDAVVAAHVLLPQGKVAAIQILNPFESRGGATIRFERIGFNATECTVDGKTVRLGQFLHAQNYGDGRLPLIGDFSGAGINASIRAINLATGQVDFYAPVFPGVDYHLAKPIENYAEAFAEKAKQLPTDTAVFGCNCILNYLYGELEGRAPLHPPGPITFGEVGHQLLNQTFVMLSIY
jgi:hypothetical protein